MRLSENPLSIRSDGTPFNLGVRNAKGNFICRVDSDDVLLALPDTMSCEVHFGYLDRVKPPNDLTLDELILAPRAICNAMVARRELWLQYPYVEDNTVFGDILCTMQILYHQHPFTVHPKVNYLYRKREGSMQTSQTVFYHRLRHVQTVARFCQLESIEPTRSIHFLELAMMNAQYGFNSLKIYQKNLNQTTQKKHN